MTLCDKDQELVKQLRNRQALLKRWRWPLAIFNGCMVVAIFVLLVVLANFSSDDMTAKLTVVCFLLPPLLVFLALSSLWLGYVIAYWNGDPKTHLLLRLLDDKTRAS
jgi:hypothetical protein